MQPEDNQEARLQDLRSLVEPESRWDNPADAATTARLALLKMLDVLSSLLRRVDALDTRLRVREGFEGFSRDWMREREWNLPPTRNIREEIHGLEARLRELSGFLPPRDIDA